MQNRKSFCTKGSQNNLKEQSNEIFCLWFFFMNGFLPNPLLGIWKLFKLASNSRKSSRLLIDSLLLFIADSRYFPYCFKRRVATSCIIYSGELQMYEFGAEILACPLKWGVDTPYIVWYGESLLSASFIAGSHWWKRGVFYFNNFEGLPVHLRGHWSQKTT